MQSETMQVMTWHGKPLVSPKEFREMLDDEISLPNIYNLCHKEDFPCLHVGKKLLIPVQAAFEWLQNQRG